VSLHHALDLARDARNRAYPKPTVGAVLVRDGVIVGEGATEEGGRHAEVIALEAAGERARRATMYVTLEPCAHHGTTPPCADAIVAAGVAQVVFGARDPNPEAAGGEERLRAAGVDVEYLDSVEARRVNEAWRTWVTTGRPFVTYKAAVTLDLRVTSPGERWISGEESRRFVHELRAEVDAVAVGGGTARADAPRLDARDVPTPGGQPRRLVFSQHEFEGLERRSGPLADELQALGGEGVQSLLLEGGPTLAAAFLEADLIDKLMLFLAPRFSGSGPRFLPALGSPLTLSHLTAQPVGEDVLLETYVHLP
jgi:diaminohydroxyphosphoribosylaminopyrimidine deaminase/5-amino-6-(5-phosphoribosylamino)uracil reductase